MLLQEKYRNFLLNLNSEAAIIENPIILNLFCNINRLLIKFKVKNLCILDSYKIQCINYQCDLLINDNSLLIKEYKLDFTPHFNKKYDFNKIDINDSNHKKFIYDCIDYCKKISSVQCFLEKLITNDVTNTIGIFTKDFLKNTIQQNCLSKCLVMGNLANICFILKSLRNYFKIFMDLKDFFKESNENLEYVFIISKEKINNSFDQLYKKLKNDIDKANQLNQLIYFKKIEFPITDLIFLYTKCMYDLELTNETFKKLNFKIQYNK